MTSPQPVRPASERFADLIRPRRRTDRVTENADFLAFAWRMIRALEARAIDDPEMLIQVVALQQRLAEVPNVVISVNADRYAVDPRSALSMGECARILNIKPPSASERRKRGRGIIEARLQAAGAARFSEAARERTAIREAAAFAVTSLAEFRARRIA